MDALTFLTTLFASYPDRDLLCEIRGLPPDWLDEKQTPRKWYPLNPVALESAAKTALLWSKHCLNAYFGVLPRAKAAYGQVPIESAAWLWCDVDGGEDGPEGARAFLEAASVPAPQITICSGGGVHAYWRLSEIVALPDGDARLRFKNILRRLVRAIGGESPRAHADPSAAESARILRIPGTMNWKRAEEPRPVSVLSVEAISEFRNFGNSPIEERKNNYFPLSWWESTLPYLPAPPDRKEYRAPAYSDAGFVSEGLRRWAQTPYPEGKRHLDLIGAAAWLVRDLKLPEPVACDLLMEKARCSRGTRQITREEVEKMIRWA